MKMKLLLTLTFAFVLINIYSQSTLELNFTAFNSTDYIQLDSIQVMNLDQGGDTVLYYPDTVLSIYIVGLDEDFNMESGFRLFQNYPNPVTNQTTIQLMIPESGRVILNITDILGRDVLAFDQELKTGSHLFNFTPGNDAIYIFTACYKNEKHSIKILCSPLGSIRKASIKHVGIVMQNSLKSYQPRENFFFDYGDELLLIGYSDTLQSGILDSPEESHTYVFQFAYDIPCPGTPTVAYEGQIYNTVQIMSQCWLKENLNVGTMIQGTVNMEDNSIIEKYCYNNEPDSCSKYGGLYQWDEMMQYASQQEKRGICPSGWHLPSDEEWQVLEGAVDSQYNIGDSIWSGVGGEGGGYDAGRNLKAVNGWGEDGNSGDLFGFSGLPNGARGYPSGFFYLGEIGYWWTISESSNESSYFHYILRGYPKVVRHVGNKNYGFAVRCIKD